MTLTYRQADQVERVPPDWVWRYWLLRGALQTLVGRQSHGKSTWIAHILAAETRGDPFYGASERRIPGVVIHLSLEEPDETLRARLEAAGAVLSRCNVIGNTDQVRDITKDGKPYQRLFQFPADCVLLERVIEKTGATMAVVDGLGYSLKGNGSGAGNDFATVGAALTDLAAVAGRTGCTVFGLTHLGKAAVEALMAAIGSTAWSTVPRISWIIGLDPEDPEPDDDKRRRLVSVSKSNNKKPGYSISFKISEDETETGYASELRSSKVKADELTQGTPEDKGERADAKQFLREMLASGPADQRDVKRQAEQDGISYSTLKRAKRDLGVISTPERNLASKVVQRWWWSLPGTKPVETAEQRSFDD